MKRQAAEYWGDPFPLSQRALCMQFPLRPNYLAQVVIPRDMSKDEAERLCQFIQSLVMQEKKS